VEELAVEEQLKKVSECEAKNAFEYFVYSKKRGNIIWTSKNRKFIPEEVKKKFF